jgi:hypothetical protein
MRFIRCLAGHDTGNYEARSQFLTEGQLGCLLKYLRRLLELHGLDHFRVWYGDLLHHVETSNLDLATDIAYVAPSICIVLYCVRRMFHPALYFHCV